MWYFPSPAGVRWDPDNFANDLRAINCSQSLSWTCLDYRRTFGSQLAQQNVSLYKIAAMMGNSPTICTRHYASLSNDSLREDCEFPSSNR